jgi:hypothetical protein
MILALLAVSVHTIAAPAATPAPIEPAAIVTRYAAALAALREPSTFTVEYTLEHTGKSSLEQTHRIFRHGDNERDEILVVNGTRTTTPTVRIFRAHAYRYAVARLAPKPSAYTFVYLGPRQNGRHIDYVFGLQAKGPSDFALTQVTIDGISYLPSALLFRSFAGDGRGSITFGKNGPWWVVTGATASAHVNGGIAHERLTFANWRFPASLPSSTFAVAPPDDTSAPG